MRTLGPGSLVWKFAGDRRIHFVAGRALCLQVAHPTVSAGVAQFSDYQKNPYARLARTLATTYGIVYGEERALEAARALRKMHERIRGVDAHGHAWHALEPGAFAWVHATTFESLACMCQHFARPLDRLEMAKLYDEFRVLGHMYGVTDDDLPRHLEDFFSYYRDMLERKLEHTETAKGLLAYIKSSTPPPPGWHDRWTPAFRTAGAFNHFVTVGLLPEVLRERWGLHWSATDGAALRMFEVAVRAGWALVPSRHRYHPAAQAAFARAART
ncbi:DUF2236 domain-containing protein [Pendulispora rubella]|uniref:DUF2236 domain-containing protein n=1 Tax=Pendulispora rubella TaxID=2741070 RepID=A0ABZ2KXA4_9BACT